MCKLTQSESKIPYFNAGIYLENKKKIGKVDEIFGPINLVMFTIKMDPGIIAKSFQEEDLVYISTDKLLPLTRFTNREFNLMWMFDKYVFFDTVCTSVLTYMFCLFLYLVFAQLDPRVEEEEVDEEVEGVEEEVNLF